ncbi:hypothetical protein HMPREF1153_1290 [Selenomonas sp. CM52]|nr:hypothetical protein HMPREF1153_1290 [Selenomonas sp. CM52]
MAAILFDILKRFWHTEILIKILRGKQEYRLENRSMQRQFL